MKVKRFIYTVLLIVWMIVIFMFSNQDANKSKTTSDGVTSTIINTVENVTKQEITKEKKNNLIEDTRFLIRKCAHFTLYFVLGFLTYFTLTSYSSSRMVLYSVVFCFLYACSDEVHQMFLDGRTPKIMDVLIDTVGSSGSIGLCYFIESFRKNRVINKNTKLNFKN